MDADRFDSLARSFITPSSRRTLVSVLGAAGFGGVLASTLADEADAKKKKKKCKPCRKKKKGKCKGKKPDGTSCGEGKVCENGQCVLATCDPACIPPEDCVDGVCTCPSAQVCGEICCGEEPFCNSGYCLCENAFFCSCPADDFLCGSPPNSQCCLDSDTCDPESLCVTEECSADNAFCTPEVAFCNDSSTCACFLKVESPTSVCADFSSLPVPDVCEVVSECDGDADCAGDDVCVNMSCCDPEQPGIGVCLPECAAAPLAGKPGRERRSGASRKVALLRERG